MSLRLYPGAVYLFICMFIPFFFYSVCFFTHSSSSLSSQLLISYFRLSFFLSLSLSFFLSLSLLYTCCPSSSLFLLFIFSFHFLILLSLSYSFFLLFLTLSLSISHYLSLLLSFPFIHSYASFSNTVTSYLSSSETSNTSFPFLSQFPFQSSLTHSLHDLSSLFISSLSFSLTFHYFQSHIQFNILFSNFTVISYFSFSETSNTWEPLIESVCVACIAATDTSSLSLSPTLSFLPYDAPNDNQSSHILSPITEENSENNCDENTYSTKKSENDIHINDKNDNKDIVKNNSFDKLNETVNNSNNNNSTDNNGHNNTKVYERVRLDVHVDPVEINAPQTVLIGKISVQGKTVFFFL